MKNSSWPATANWDTWSTVTESLTLVAGANTIRFEKITDFPNFDYIDLAAATAASATPSATPTTTVKPTTTATSSGGGVSTTYPVWNNSLP